MATQHLTVDAERPAETALRAAAAALARGRLVAYPTDTLYGLGADPRDAAAVARVYQAKARPARLAMPLIAADLVQVDECAACLSPLARRLADRFWPGPLTLVLDAAPTLDPRILGEGGSVAVRVPAHPVAVALARTFGHAVTSTSANRSGVEPASDAASVMAAFGDDIALVLDGGPTTGGSPSTIVDARDTAPVLVRAGAVPWDRVLQSVA